MKQKLFSRTIIVLTVSVFVLGLALGASAQTTGTTTNTATASGTKAQARTQAAVAKLIANADNQITQRITALNSLSTKVQAMQKLSADQKNTIISTIQSQLTDLATLKSKIDADTVLATLRTDVQSITKSLRIYALVIPQEAITAASDRVLSITDDITAIETKVQTRISSLPSGTDTSAIQLLISDLNSKISDATTQANAAVTEVSGLTPDNGNTTQAQSNKTALTDARAKIKTASIDLQTARKDIGTIVKDIEAIKNPGNGTPASTTPTTTNP